jgi:hypothetical protein
MDHVPVIEQLVQEVAAQYFPAAQAPDAQAVLDI